MFRLCLCLNEKEMFAAGPALRFSDIHPRLLLNKSLLNRTNTVQGRYLVHIPGMGFQNQVCFYNPREAVLLTLC